MRHLETTTLIPPLWGRCWRKQQTALLWSFYYLNTHLLWLICLKWANFTSLCDVIAIYLFSFNCWSSCQRGTGAQLQKGDTLARDQDNSIPSCACFRISMRTNRKIPLPICVTVRCCAIKALCTSQPLQQFKCNVYFEHEFYLWHCQRGRGAATQSLSHCLTHTHILNHIYTVKACPHVLYSCRDWQIQLHAHAIVFLQLNLKALKGQGFLSIKN